MKIDDEYTKVVNDIINLHFYPIAIIANALPSTSGS